MLRQLSFLSCAIICAAAFSVAHGETTQDYVQDGLLACWDGVENAGRHCHASSTAVWKDVVDGREFSLTGVTVGADRMVFAGSASSYGTLNATDTAATFEKAKNGTVEIVYASSTGTGNQVILQSTTTSGISLGINNATLLIVHSSQVTPKISFSSGIATNGVSLRYGNGLFSSALVNGSAATMDSSATTYWGGADSATTTIGTRTSKASAHFTGSLYCIRVYGRQLTDAEIQANNAVDVSRFRQGNVPGEDDLVITATPLEVEVPMPSCYGEEGGLAAGATREVSGPAAWTNAAENVAVTCTGWKLYDSAGNELSSGPETSFTYTHPTPAAFRRLEWQLSLKYKVSASTVAGGSVSPAEQWVILGETATVTATPDASHVFYRWTNGVPASVAATASAISFPVISPMSLFATFGDLCPVSDISTLQSVINSHGRGDVILLSDNLHRPNYTINLTNGVTLAGSSAEKCIIKPTGDRRVLYMSGAASCISNITITGGKMTTGWNHGAGILMINGTVTHCMISNNNATASNSFGGGIMAYGGTITHSVITRNSATSGHGGGLYLGRYGYNTLDNPVLVDRCLVFRNTASGTAGGIFTYAGAGGNTIVIRHTTVANNTAASIGGLFIQTIKTIGSIESCIFADNVQNTAGTQTGQPNWQISDNSTSTKFKNCLFGNGSSTSGSNPVSGNAAFKSLANHDYHLDAISDAIDTGLVSANVTEDLDGYDVTDGHPDIGCYEFDLSREPFSCVLDYSASSIFEGATVSLSATPVNPPEGTTLRYVWTISDGGENVLAATGAAAELTLANTGTYTVVLRAYDDTTDALLLEVPGEKTLPIHKQTLYARPGDDLTAICAGLVDGQRLFLAEGTFALTRKTSINAGVEVIGAGRDATILQLGTADVTFDVSHINASLSGVTIRGAYSSGGRHTVTIQRGVLRDSRVTQCGIYGAKYGYAPLFIDNGGLVERCVIDNNTNTTSVGYNTWTYTRAGAVIVKNGTLRNCLVHHNYASGSDGTVYIGANNGGDGLVANCTIVDNLNAGTTLEAVAVLIGNNGNIRNTIVARNSSPNWTTNHTDNVENQEPTGSAPSWAVRSKASAWTSRASYNCWGESPATYGSHCANGSKISFINPVNGNWRTGVNSSCRDKGLNETWMADAIDLAGQPRIFHGIVDLGCYENQSMPHTVLMLR